jgi:Zn-dependent M28 family amino/carboxypeptidase
MVSQVSRENLASYIQSLQDFETRYASSENCEYSGAYIYDFFDRLGLKSEYDPFNFGSRYSSRNVIATISGGVAPDQVIIVCAHYDSTSNQAAVQAPGADDDASGTAAVMEMARIMSGYSFDFTVKFICFSAEEWGLWGSKHYAQAARQNEDRILAVINMDMIGFTNALPEDLDLIANQRSEWLVDRFIFSSTPYTALDFRKTINASITSSDHSPFWDQGYSALLGIEDTPLANPYYHKTTDTIDTLNMDFVASVAGASIAAAADLAQPESIPSAPSNLTARSQISRSLFSRFKTTYLTWGPSRHQVVGYRVYRSDTSRAHYQLIDTVPPSKTAFADRFLRADANYFYVITAVDGQGRESNYSEEVRDDQDNQTR